MTKIFYKKIFETTLLVCSSCVIFSGTVSAVLLMLAWPNDRILGLSTRLVITVSATPVAATLAQTHLLFLDRHVKTFSMSDYILNTLKFVQRHLTVQLHWSAVVVPIDHRK